MRDIGKNIKSLREEKKLSQVQLAEKLFVTRQTVSNYEIGRSRPDVEMLTRIADVLDVDISMIIYGVQPSSERYIERKKLVIAFLVTIVLGIMWFILNPLAQAYRSISYSAIPQILLQSIVLTSWLIMFGWTLTQSFHVFFGVKRFKGEKIRLFRAILLTILAFWILLVLPPVVDMLRLEIIRWQWLQTHSSYSSADFALPGIWQNLVWNSLSLGLLYYIPKYCGIFPILGISLWLTDFPKRVHTAEGGEDYAN